VLNRAGYESLAFDNLIPVANIARNIADENRGD
jgi:hypothetical protein